jgi:Fe-S-cluster containining protein
MKLAVLPDEHFSCRSCTNCCRHWHVELLPDDLERLHKLTWPAGDPLGAIKPTFQHAGKTYLAHRDDGACVFLNDANGLCRIHETFGGPVKPLGCQLYPFQITPTFSIDQATVMTRYDCPAVRSNAETPLVDTLPLIRRYAEQLHARHQLTEPFDQRVRCGLSPDQITAVSEFVATLSNGFPRDDQRALFIAYTCDWLATLPADEMDREALGRAFGDIRDVVMRATAVTFRPPGWMHRTAFRTLLALYLRRDEDVLDGRAGRAGRMMAMSAVVMGHGSFRGLGRLHPVGRVRKTKLFQPGAWRADAVPEMPLLRRLIRTKLESLQFMGGGARGRDFLTGLRSLALLYPLVVSAAKYRATGRGATTLDDTDVDYGVAAIEYSFGRAAVLAQPFALSLERTVLESNAFTRIARTI